MATYTACLSELEDLLDRVAFVPASDRLTFVGDLCRRGPDSAGVVRLAMELGARAVLGNHEARLLAKNAFEPATRGSTVDVAREPNKTQECVGASIEEAPDREELGAWIAALPLVLRDDDVLVVHAAVPPSLWNDSSAEPRPDERDFALSARYCDDQGRRPPKDWPAPAAPYAPWHAHYRGQHRVVYGHWARQGLHVADRLRGLDSGCVYGRELSAWIAEEDRIVQVKARRAYA